MSATSAVEGVEALGTRPVGRLLWRGTAQATMSVGVYGIYALSNAWFVAPILFAVGALSTAVGVGGAPPVSRRLGAGDTAGAARAAGNAFMVFWADLRP